MSLVMANKSFESPFFVLLKSFKISFQKSIPWKWPFFMWWNAIGQPLHTTVASFRTHSLSLIFTSSVVCVSQHLRNSQHESLIFLLTCTHPYKDGDERAHKRLSLARTHAYIHQCAWMILKNRVMWPSLLSYHLSLWSFIDPNIFPSSSHLWLDPLGHRCWFGPHVEYCQHWVRFATQSLAHVSHGRAVIMRIYWLHLDHLLDFYDCGLPYLLFDQQHK